MLFGVVWAAGLATFLVVSDVYRGEPVWWRFDLAYPVAVVLLWWAASWCWRRLRLAGREAGDR